MSNLCRNIFGLAQVEDAMESIPAYSCLMKAWRFETPSEHLRNIVQVFEVQVILWIEFPYVR